MYISVKEGEGEKLEEDKLYDNEQRYFVYYKEDELAEILKKNKFRIIKSEISINRGNRWVNIFCQKI